MNICFFQVLMEVLVIVGITVDINPSLIELSNNNDSFVLCASRISGDIAPGVLITASYAVHTTDSKKITFIT